MAENNQIDDIQKVPGWFWAVATIALIWNLMGLTSFFSYINQSSEILARLPEAQQQLYLNTPGWVNVAFGVAVIGGTLASAALFVRKAVAYPLFIVSLVGVLAQNIYSFFLSNTFEVMGKSNMILPLMVIAIAILLVWFSKNMKQQGMLT